MAAMAQALASAGVDLIQLANSYSIKNGMSGLSDTIDAVRAAGMEPGEYELGGQKIKLQKNRAVISGTKTIAGSVASLPEGLRYVVKETGIPLEVAVQCVTKNPARSLGIYEECGSVSVGKRADLVLLDEDLNVTAVVKNGVLI